MKRPTTGMGVRRSRSDPALVARAMDARIKLGIGEAVEVHDGKCDCAKCVIARFKGFQNEQP